MLACGLACLPDTDKEISRMSLLKTVLPFLTNQAMQLCSLSSFADFIFPHEFHLVYALHGSVKDFGSMYFFNFKT